MKSFFLFLAIFFQAIMLVNCREPDRKPFSSGAPGNEPEYLLRDRKDIIGNWISEDSSWTIGFKSNGFCDISDLKSFTEYHIVNSSPQCGVEVLVDEQLPTTYLQLIDVRARDTICYEINGIEEYLSLSPVGTGGAVLFTRLN